MYSKDKIAEVVAGTDLVALVRQFVDLKRTGNSYVGICPFHTEKTASFHVTPEKGVYHCFGCGAGGNALTFIMGMNKLSFPEAMEELARSAGVALPREKRSVDKDSGFNRQDFYDVMNRAAILYQNLLWAQPEPEAMTYLRSRGISLDLARSYQLGLSFNGWEYLRGALKKEGFDDLLLAEAGLTRARQTPGAGFYDVFRNRLMIPVCDPQGRAVAFAGRTLPSETNPEVAKYINSPSTAIYHKGNLLYGFHQARSHLRGAGLAFLVEGYFDLLSLVQAKVQNVVASMGTAVTQAQINLLRGQVKEVYLLFDGDAAGRKAASRALPYLLNVELDGKVITLPDGEDPDTFIRKRGSEGLYEVAEKAKDIIDYYIEGLLADCGPTLGGESRAIREARETLGHVPDLAKGELLRRKLAKKLNIDPNVLKVRPQSPPAKTPEKPVEVRDPAKTVTHIAQEILVLIIVHPELAKNLPALAPYWPQDASFPVYEALTAQFKESGQIAPEKIHLEENQEISSIISGALLSPRTKKPEDAAVIFNEMIISLKALAAKAEQMDKSQALKAAEKEGNEELVKTLAQEKAALPHPLMSKMKPQ
ncbi:MAG: DNA primase [Deltaproteobacteria bacterium]|nr:DNA primase [Deltaproteobacteria bacterium]